MASASVSQINTGANDGDAVASASQRFRRSVVALAGSPRLDMEMSRLLAEMRPVFFRAGPAEDFHRPYVERNAEIAPRWPRGGDGLPPARCSTGTPRPPSTICCRRI